MAKLSVSIQSHQNFIRQNVKTKKGVRLGYYYYPYVLWAKQ
jgi:hypothetical protein